MNLLYEPPELPPTAWTTQMPLSADADVERWIAEQLDAAGTHARRLSGRQLDTARGWALELVTYDVDGRLLVLAQYRFIDLLGAIAVGGLEPAWVTAHQLELVAALRAVEPDWISDEPLTLRELWTEPVA